MLVKRLLVSVLCTQLAFTPTASILAAEELATESLNLNLPSMGAVAGTELSPLEEQALGEAMMNQIENCIHCNHCRDHCPYQLDTPNLLKYMLKDYREFYEAHKDLL